MSIDPHYRELIAETVAETLRAMSAADFVPARKFVTSDEAAKLMTLKPSTLATMRSRGTSPAWSGSGRFIRYSVDVINQWIIDNPRGVA